jgi:glutathione synthase/RimK-type ligase-like ATP-grasp enzyme
MILIISNTEDVTTDFLVREIRKRNIEFARLNTDEFPNNGIGVSTFGFGDKDIRTLYFGGREKKIDFDCINSVIYRRPVPPIADQSIKSPYVKKYCVDENYEFLRGLWYSLDCYWMSDPEAIRKAEHKINQLKIATKLDFKIPKTLITNSPLEVTAFYKECNKKIVIKSLYMGFIDDPENPQSIFTSTVTEKDLENINTLKCCPAIFQENIDKRYDLRVTVIGEEVIAVKIVSNNLPKEIPDWRYLDIKNLEHSVYDLPKDIETQCIKLVRELNLDFGAIDIAVDNHGCYYFFEINPNGQWAWLENLLDLPMSELIIDRVLTKQKF